MRRGRGRGLLSLCRHCEERGDEAIHSFFARHYGLLRFARNDGVIHQHTPPHSRGPITRVLSILFSLKRGSRECRVRAAPAVSCAKLCERTAHEHTGSAETLRHSPRNGFMAYAVISSATNSSCHRRQRISGLTKPGWARNTSADLAPATGAGTTRFCRTQPPVSA